MVNWLEIVKIVVPTALIFSTIGFSTSAFFCGANAERREQEAYQQGLSEGKSEVESKVKEDLLNKIEKSLNNREVKEE